MAFQLVEAANEWLSDAADQLAAGKLDLSGSGKPPRVGPGAPGKSAAVPVPSEPKRSAAMLGSEDDDSVDHTALIAKVHITSLP